jgi:hypothetical protein
MSFRIIRLMLLGVAALAALTAALYVVWPADETQSPPAPKPLDITSAPESKPAASAQTPDPKPAEPKTIDGKTADGKTTEGKTEPRRNVPPELAAARAKAEATIAAAPDIARFYERLRDIMPRDYDNALNALARAGQVENADAMLSDSVKFIRQLHGAAGARSDAASLQAVFDNQLKVLEALAPVSAKQCVDFLSGAASDGFMQFAAANRPLIAGLAIAGLDAIINGEEKDIVRTAPTEADFATLEKALLAAGLKSQDIEALLDGKQPDPPLPDARTCASGITYLKVLAAAPEATRLRIYALAIDLMAKN